MVIIILILAVGIFWIYAIFSNTNIPKHKTDCTAHAVVNKMLSSKNVKIEKNVMEYSIVGESKYQENISEHAGEHSERGAHTIVDVSIKSEPENPYDKNAVVVQIENKTVGYIAKSDLPWFTPLLKKSSDGIVTCKAEIRGGGRKAEGFKMSYGLFLQIPLS